MNGLVTFVHVVDASRVSTARNRLPDAEVCAAYAVSEEFSAWSACWTIVYSLSARGAILAMSMRSSRATSACNSDLFSLSAHSAPKPLTPIAKYSALDHSPASSVKWRTSSPNC